MNPQNRLSDRLGSRAALGSQPPYSVKFPTEFLALVVVFPVLGTRHDVPTAQCVPTNVSRVKVNGCS